MKIATFILGLALLLTMIALLIVGAGVGALASSFNAGYSSSTSAQTAVALESAQQGLAAFAVAIFFALLGVAFTLEIPLLSAVFYAVGTLILVLPWLLNMAQWASSPPVVGFGLFVMMLLSAGAHLVERHKRQAADDAAYPAG